MNYSLVCANLTTHFKIVAVAIVGSTLLAFGIHASSAMHPNNQVNITTDTITQPTPAEPLSIARIENATVCRYTTL